LFGGLSDTRNDRERDADDGGNGGARTTSDGDDDETRSSARASFFSLTLALASRWSPAIPGRRLMVMMVEIGVACARAKRRREREWRARAREKRGLRESTFVRGDDDKLLTAVICCLCFCC
jgi:hypothetical protein